MVLCLIDKIKIIHYKQSYILLRLEAQEHFSGEYMTWLKMIDIDNIGTTPGKQFIGMSSAPTK